MSLTSAPPPSSRRTHATVHAPGYSRLQNVFRPQNPARRAEFADGLSTARPETCTETNRRNEYVKRCVRTGRRAASAWRENESSSAPRPRIAAASTAESGGCVRVPMNGADLDGCRTEKASCIRITKPRQRTPSVWISDGVASAQFLRAYTLKNVADF
ncbi:hypothetical protein LSAT2_000690 [Lamellibrachia satsuma]|nr:hypothetical protein LSAT2_000690 [Lamellibrachia satsuma]